MPVQLPPGEDPSLWLKPLSLAGLEPGVTGGGAWVELRDEGSRWRLRVRDTTGAIREATVTEPASSQAREDVAWLAASLLKPASAASRTLPTAPGLALPPPPSPPPTPPPKVRVVQPPPEPVPWLVVAPPEPEPVVEAPVELIPQPPVPPPALVVVEEEEPLPLLAPEPIPIRPEFAAGTGVGWRPGLEPGSVTWLRLGPRVEDVLVIGLEASFGTAVGILAIDTDHRVIDGDAILGAWFVGPTRFPLRVGIGGGAAYRSFTAGKFEESGIVPVLGAELGIDLHIGPWLRLGPALGARFDLRSTEVSQEGGAAVMLSPVALRGGLSLAIGAQTSDPSPYERAKFP